MYSLTILQQQRFAKLAAEQRFKRTQAKAQQLRAFVKYALSTAILIAASIAAINAAPSWQPATAQPGEITLKSEKMAALKTLQPQPNKKVFTARRSPG